MHQYTSRVKFLFHTYSRFVYFFAVILISLFIAIQADAQQEVNKSIHMVWEIELNPTQLNMTTQAIKDQNEFYKMAGYPYPNFTYYTHEGYLWYTVPLSGYGDIEKIQETALKLWSSYPKQMQEFQERFQGTYNNMGRIILIEQPELSILPIENIYAKSGQQFRFIEKFYIKHGKEELFDQLLRKYVSLRKQNRIKAPFYTYYPSFSHNLSVVYCIDELGNSAIEYYTLIDKAWDKFGAEGQKLRQDLMQVIEKVETYVGQIDYNLNYFPTTDQLK